MISRLAVACFLILLCCPSSGAKCDDVYTLLADGQVAGRAVEADSKYFDEIMEIQESLRWKAGYDEEKGFLIHLLPREELQEVASRYQGVQVFIQEKKVTGYTVSFPSEHLHNQRPHWSELLRYLAPDAESLLKGNFVFQQQIGVTADAPRGTGLILTSKLRERLKAQGVRYLVGEIALDNPRNERSIKFHEARGARRIAEYKDGNGTLWGIYCLSL